MKKHYPTYAIFLLLLLAGCSSDDSDSGPYKGPGSGYIEDPDPVALSSEKQLLNFQLIASVDPCSMELSSTIDEAAKSVSILIPYTASITSIAPITDVSEGATLSPSGVQDFTQPQTYTVTAEDGSVAEYTVTVTLGLSDREILTKLAESNPNNAADWDLQDPELNRWQGVTAGNDNRVLELNLSQLGFTVLPPEIGQLCYLERLTIVNNRLSAIPSEIGQLKNLRYLTLNNVDINSLPPEIGQLSQLEFLSATGNNLSTLPMEIGQLNALQTMDLSANRLNAIPASLGQLVNLRALDLQDNRITDIPAQIGSLASLENLNLASNDFIAMPPEIGQLSNLRELMLEKGKLRSLPDEIGQLGKLNSLVIARNDLSTLPASLGNATDLTYLNANRNDLLSLPAELGNLTRLNLLVVRNNDFRSIPGEVCNLSTAYGTRIYKDPYVNCE